MTAAIGNEERQMVIDLASRIGRRFGLDYWSEQDRKKEFPGQMWKEICAAGLGGVAIPEEYGGGGMGMVEMGVIVEELAAGGGGSTVGQLFMLTPIFGGLTVSRYGTEAMKAELLP